MKVSDPRVLEVRAYRSEMKRLLTDFEVLKNKENSIQAKIKEVKNSPEVIAIINQAKPKIIDMKTEVNKYNDQIRELSADIGKCQFVLELYNKNIYDMNKLVDSFSKLKNVHNDTVIRIKSYPLRFGLREEVYKPASDNFIKKIWNYRRYECEKSQARKSFGTGKENVTINLLHQKVDATHNKIKQLQQNLGKLNKSLTPVQGKFDELTQLINEEKKEIDSQINSRLTTENSQLDKINEQIATNTSRRNELTSIVDRFYTVQNGAFFSLYQSNAGSSVLNKVARALFGNSQIDQKSLPKLNAKAIYNEYYKAFTYNFREPEWNGVKERIKGYCCDGIKKFVENAANDIYQPKMENIKTYRGARIQKSGFNKIKEMFNNATTTPAVIKAGQFFSTSESEARAKDFIDRSTGEKPILIVIDGNSGTRLRGDSGLQFSEGLEKEVVYSPHACFLIRDIQGNTIYLEETEYDENAPVFPYQ